MGEIFTNANPELWRAQSRSLRLRGVSTSVRLETVYWQVLDEIGRHDGLTVNQLLAKLHDELSAARGAVTNFASFLRVCCTRYLTLQLAGRIPTNTSIPIRSLDAGYVLAGESRGPPRTARAA